MSRLRILHVCNISLLPMQKVLNLQDLWQVRPVRLSALIGQLGAAWLFCAVGQFCSLTQIIIDVKYHWTPMDDIPEMNFYNIRQHYSTLYDKWDWESWDRHIAIRSCIPSVSIAHTLLYRLVKLEHQKLRSQKSHSVRYRVTAMHLFTDNPQHNNW